MFAIAVPIFWSIYSDASIKSLLVSTAEFSRHGMLNINYVFGCHLFVYKELRYITETCMKPALRLCKFQHSGICLFKFQHRWDNNVY